MKGIQATSNVTLGPVTVGPVRPQDSYFGVANSILPAVNLLALSDAPVSIPLSILTAHALECLLKAAIVKTTRNESELSQSPLRHNLMKLWERAVACNLDLPSVPYDWVETLSRLHDSPYVLRFAPKVMGIVTPNSKAMGTGLQYIFDVVQTFLLR